MSRNEIDTVHPQLRVVHFPAEKTIGNIAILRPNRAFRPRSGQKIARVSAQYNASSSALFAYFFWQDRWNQIANQRSVCNLERTSNGTDETCRLRRDEGCGVCEDEGLRSNGCGVAAFNGSPVNPDKRADVHPQGVGRLRSAPSSLTAALAIGPYKVPCRIVCEAAAAAPPQIRGVSSA